MLLDLNIVSSMISWDFLENKKISTATLFLAKGAFDLGSPISFCKTSTCCYNRYTIKYQDGVHF